MHLPATEDAVSYVEDRLGESPAVAIVLGSGLGAFTERLEGRREVSYGSIPGWPEPSAAGHAGRLITGRMDDTPVAVLSGRVHLYEGYTARQVAFGVGVMGRWGVRRLVVTNAAGAIDSSLRPGQLVLVADHINLQGASPLVGPLEAGQRFPDMSNAYSPRLRRLAREAASEEGIELPEVVYAAVVGPNYETPAEIRFLRTIGADVVGMSTVAEVIKARELGLEVLALSSVTNLAAGVGEEKLAHGEVLDVAGRIEPVLGGLLRRLVPKFAAVSGSGGKDTRE